MWRSLAPVLLVAGCGESIAPCTSSATPLPFNGNLQGAWGSARDDVWFVGDGILRWDGATLRSYACPYPGTMHAVWGSSRGDVWIAGDQGLLLHHDARGLSRVASGTDADLLRLWGARAGDFWILAADGVLRSDGKSVTRSLSQDMLNLHGDRGALGGTAADDVWASGGARLNQQGTAVQEMPVMRWNGAAWIREQRLGAVGKIDALFSPAPGEMWGAGKMIAPHGTYNLTPHCANPDGCRLDAVSSASRSDSLEAVWGNRKDNVWFGGTRIYRWDGQRGQDFTDGRVPAIEAMWGSADDDVWAVGRGILHWDGKVWRAAP